MSTPYAIGDEPVPGSGYRLVKFLGRGGFGEVWKATAPGGAEAALKIICFGTRESRKEFRALQLVKRIHHTHLVPIIAFWIKNDKGQVLDDDAVRRRANQPDSETSVSSNTLAVSMLVPQRSTDPDCPAELIIAMGLGDQSLFDRLEECRQEGLPGIPDDELLDYLQDSAEAIDFLNSPIHDLGSGPIAIQHCDIKPHNLLIVGGSVQVCDFGLARMMGSDRATTAAASLAYAAPECLIEGKPSDSTDQYCLAVAFMELKTGQLPYHDLSMAAVMDAKRHEKLDFGELPKAVQAVLRRATSRDPKKRYASCGEMVQQLRQALQRSGPSGKRTANRGLLRLLAIAMTLAVASGGSWWAWQRFGAQERIPLVPVRPDAAQPPIVSLPPASSPRPTGPTSKPVKLPVSLPSQSDPAQAQIRQGEAYLASGTKALESKDFTTAATDLQRASKIRPRDARVFSRLGAAWLGQRQWERAVASYTSALEIEPYDNDYLARGRAYMELKATEKAIADFTAATRLNSGNAAAYVALGDAYLEKDEAAQAIASFGMAVKICSGDPRANYPLLSVLLLRANTYLSLEKNTEAAGDMALALPLISRDDRPSVQSALDALDALSSAYADAGQYSDAVKWAKKSVELAPDPSTKDTFLQRLRAYEAAESHSRAKHSPP